jgi:hypothetical protein
MDGFVDLPGRNVLFAFGGTYGTQLVGRWQITLTDHRRRKPPFSAPPASGADDTSAPTASRLSDSTRGTRR